MQHASERRVHERSGLKSEVTCVRADRSRFSAKAIDISLGGLCVQSDQRVRTGEMLTIFTKLPGNSQLLMLPATVRWHRPGSFGVQFTSLNISNSAAIQRHAPSVA